ncbi:MAG TPA: hypothetical protein PLP17_15390, partial [Oligoflexia bacterium]|nr:hypothetical protein [Oligoflexia bacterium]
HQARPSAQTAPAVDSSTAQTEENLRASRAGLEAERKQLEVERLQAEQAADHAAAARLVQELELVSRLDLLFLQQMSALQRMTELEAERAQLLQEKASVPAPPKPADKPTFSMLEDLRSQLAGQRERQLEIELNLASSARALEDAAAVLEQKESARRKAKEEADTADLPIQRVEREGLLRAAVLESRLQRQIVEVRASERKNWELALEAAKLRLELIQRRIAASKPQVQMSENDLVQALSGLDAREKSLRSALEEAKGRLALCERRFFEARAKVQAGVQIEQQLGEQIETQRVCRDAAQEEMSILGERLAMAASSREIWQRRFKLHHGDYRGADLKIWHAEVSAVLKGVEQRDRMQNSHQTALRGELKRIAARIDADRDAGGNLGSLLAKQRTQLRKTESVYGDYSEDNEA